MKNLLRFCAPLLVLAMSTVALGQSRSYASPLFKKVDTKLGFTMSVPEWWSVGRPSGDNKFVAGGGDDDFAVIVSDFGPVPRDAAAADGSYRENFAKSGLRFVSSSEATIAGVEVRKYVLSVESAAGPGHVEVVMLPSRGRVYSVMVATPAREVDARRATVDAIFASLASSR